MPEQFTIKGQIRYSDEHPADGVIVQAFDKDLPSLERRTGAGPQELGSALTDREGHFAITFGEEHFRRGEASANDSRRRRRQGPDLVFRVSDSKAQIFQIDQITANDLDLTRSRVLFNAPLETRLVIIVEHREEAGLSEYEQLVAQLSPVIEDVSLTELTDEDVAFLMDELQFDEEQTARLRWLRGAAVLLDRTGVVAEAFYGWARTGLPGLWSELRTPGDEDHRNAVTMRVLDELTTATEDALIAHLLRAIEERIIPARIRARVSNIARAIRRSAEQKYTVRLRLEIEPTGEPLVGYTVTAYDSDNNNQDLGTDVTDSLGEFAVEYFATDNVGAVDRSLRFRVRGPAITEPIEVTERIRPATNDVTGIRLSLPTAQPTLRQLRANERIDVPDAILETLEHKHGIRSFADIRRRGGLSRIAAVRALDSSATRRLDALADLDRLTGDLNEMSVLLKNNFDSVVAIAEASRREFITAMSMNGTSFSERRATELHVAARAQTDMLDQIFAGIATDFAHGIRSQTGFVSGDYFPPFPSEEE